MYKCENCGADFENYGTITEENGEKRHICPVCKSADFSESEKCELCGEYYTESSVLGACQGCITATEEKFSNMLCENFTEFEKSVLNTVFDGRNLE